MSEGGEKKGSKKPEINEARGPRPGGRRGIPRGALMFFVFGPEKGHKGVSGMRVFPWKGKGIKKPGYTGRKEKLSGKTVRVPLGKKKAE